MMLRRKLHTLGRFLWNRPARAWELLQIRFERRTGIPIFFVSPRRLGTYLFELANTSRIPREFTLYGNYFLRSDLLGARPTVFSIGVGADVRFDQALIKEHNTEIFLFDPTPSSKRYVEGLDFPQNVHFSPLAVADHDGEIELYTDDLETNFDLASSLSSDNRGFSKESFKVPCRRIKTLMAESGTRHLDVLKLDVEGAAIKILRDTLGDAIYPTQIAAEFERPAKLREVWVYLNELSALLSRLRALGYRIYRTRTLDKGCQVEITAVRLEDRAAST